MNELLSCLNSANDAYIKLFFVIRKKDQTTKEITYSVLSSRILPEVARDLKTSGINQLHGILSHDHELVNYDVLSQSDRKIIETIDYSCVPYLQQILSEIAAPVNDNLLSNDDYPHVWGYIVRVESNNKTAFLFRKYTPKKLLEKGKLACVIDRQGQFAKINDQAIVLDSHYDAALLLRTQEPGTPEVTPIVYIFSHGSFDSLFSFIDQYQHQIETKKADLAGKGFLENISTMVDTCCADTRAMRKLAKILASASYNTLTQETITETIRDYNLSVELNGEGKIQVSDDNIWEVLRILNDDYGESKATGNKYEMRSKVRK